MTIGIDLGTTNSLVAVYEAGFPMVLADPDGARITPSAVWYPPDGAPVAGRGALRRRGADPERVVLSVKRLMGLREREVADDERPVALVAQPDGQAALEIGGTPRAPEEISAVILAKLKADAGRALGREVEKAVITVPAYFNDAQRAATRRAGELAGLKVARILSEPTAAALAFGMGRDGGPDAQRIAVFDFGGGTFDLSILELQDGVFDVLATHGDTRLGGDDMDLAVARLILEKTGASADDPVSRARLLEAAETARIALSSLPETEVLLPFLGENHAGVNLTRAELETAVAPVLRRIPSLCRRALHDSGVKTDDLDRVLLVGGATRMPRVRAMAAEIFGREPDTSQHPDETVALGAAVQGAILDGRLGGIALLDVTPLSLGIETFGGLMNVLIPRNTTIPCKAGEMFANAASGQTAMRITVIQGEREMAKDNWKLGEFVVPFTPAEKGRARVGVQFELDADGILTVLARDIATGRDQVLKIEGGAVDVAEERVEQMVSSSVDHALDDMNERVFIEASQKAAELLEAVDMAMTKLSDHLTPGERAEIEDLTTRVRAAMDHRDGGELKQLVNKLDKLTEPLAAKLLEVL